MDEADQELSDRPAMVQNPPDSGRHMTDKSLPSQAGDGLPRIPKDEGPESDIIKKPAVASIEQKKTSKS